LSDTFFMKIHNFLGNLAIKEKMFVFRKENHASICTCSWTFLVHRVTRNQRRGHDENLILSGCLITVSPLASHFRGAWLQWVPSPLTTYQTNIIRDVQKRLLQRLGTCAIDAEVKASFFVTFLQELVPLHYVCDSDHQSKPDVFQCGTGGSDSPSLKTRFTVEREVCNLRLILRWLTCGLNATIPKIAIFNTASLYKLSSIHEPLGKLICYPCNSKHSHTNPNAYTQVHTIPNVHIRFQTLTHDSTQFHTFSHTFTHNSTHFHTILYISTQLHMIPHNYIYFHTIIHDSTQFHSFSNDSAHFHT